MTLDITVLAGEVIGIGKLKIFATEDFSHIIPTLSFVVAKDNKGIFTATCIQLLIDGDGGTPNAAMKSMGAHVKDFLTTLFGNDKTKEQAWAQLHDLYQDSFAEPYWNAYRNVQLNLAEQGINTDSKTAVFNYIAKLEKQIADLRAIIESQPIANFEPTVVDYEEPAA